MTQKELLKSFAKLVATMKEWDDLNEATIIASFIVQDDFRMAEALLQAAEGRVALEEASR